jgi:peptidoglycan/xylan/chitin deacetylase (PgdA/CDA1 family)
MRNWRALAFVIGMSAAALPIEPAQRATPAAQNPPSKATPKPLEPHPVVALTFDDLPAAGGLAAGQTRTATLTRLAHELNVAHLRGTYGFVNAVDLDDDPDTQHALRAWVAAGMNIGNHTWSHPLLSDVTAEEFEENIARDEPALREYAAGRDWHWFRYPDLDEGDTLAKRDYVRAWLRAHGYRIAEPTLNFQDDDWSDPYNRCLARHDDAAIAWLKQSYLDNAAEFIRVGREEQQIVFGHEIPNVLLLHATGFTTLMLPRVIDLLRREGFRFAPLAKIEADPAYGLDPHAGIPGGGTFPNLFMNARHLPYPPFTPEPADKLDHLCR